MRIHRVQGKGATQPELLPVLLVVLVLLPNAAAEELVLKNGQKISGTIVGFENDMFRVQTEYGFALVRKEKVEVVNVSPGAKDEPAKKSKPAAQANPSGAPPRTNTPAVKPSNPVPVAANKPAASSPPETAKRAPPPPPSQPLDEPLPPRLQEHVEGNTYVNDSFQFAMFKPPGWIVYEEVPRETGAAVMAMGTEDEQTLLFVDRQAWSGTPDLKNEAVEAGLRATYQEYQKILESPITLNGHPAVRRVFKGVIDGVEWHGVSVRVLRGNAVFGVVGLTSAETYQFQQAIFNKIINSFHFLTPALGSAASSSSVSKR